MAFASRSARENHPPDSVWMVLADGVGRIPAILRTTDAGDEIGSDEVDEFIRVGIFSVESVRHAANEGGNPFANRCDEEYGNTSLGGDTKLDTRAGGRIRKLGYDRVRTAHSAAIVRKNGTTEFFGFVLVGTFRSVDRPRVGFADIAESLLECEHILHELHGRVGETAAHEDEWVLIEKSLDHIEYGFITGHHAQFVCSRKGKTFHAPPLALHEMRRPIRRKWCHEYVALDCATIRKYANRRSNERKVLNAKRKLFPNLANNRLFGRFTHFDSSAEKPPFFSCFAYAPMILEENPFL